MTKLAGDSALHELLASRTLVPLLKTLLLNPDQLFYQRELAGIAQARLYSVQSELGRLERIGLITKVRRGNRAYYQADRRHPLFVDLKNIVLKTVALGDAIRAALSRDAGAIRLAFIYGSYAAGEERSTSDIDLLLVGNLTLKESAAILGPVGRDLGREINPVLYQAAEFRRKIKDGNHFLKEILDGPRIFLIGDEDGLAALRG